MILKSKGVTCVDLLYMIRKQWGHVVMSSFSTSLSGNYSGIFLSLPPPGLLSDVECDSGYSAVSTSEKAVSFRVSKRLLSATHGECLYSWFSNTTCMQLCCMLCFLLFTSTVLLCICVYPVTSTAMASDMAVLAWVWFTVQLKGGHAITHAGRKLHCGLFLMPLARVCDSYTVTVVSHINSTIVSVCWLIQDLGIQLMFQIVTH